MLQEVFGVCMFCAYLLSVFNIVVMPVNFFTFSGRLLETESTSFLNVIVLQLKLRLPWALSFHQHLQNSLGGRSPSIA